MKTYEAAFGVGDRVYHADLESWVRIVGVFIGMSSTTFEIAYWHNGKRETCYVHANELRIEK